jgi:hypothetical protein
MSACRLSSPLTVQAAESLPPSLQITFFTNSLAKKPGTRWSLALPCRFADRLFHASVLHFSGAGRRRIAWKGQRFSTNPVLKNPGGGL